MSINAARTLLKQGKTALFICDIQENVIKAMFEFDKIVQNSRKLRMRDIGCHISTSERVPITLTRSADHEKFKELLKFAKEGTLYTGLVPVSKI